MLRIRLRRQGKKKQPHYRIVVAESRAPRDGVFVESIGHYNPLTDPEEVVVDVERLHHWIGHGAQPSETVGKLLRRKGVALKAEAAAP